MSDWDTFLLLSCQPVFRVPTYTSLAGETRTAPCRLTRNQLSYTYLSQPGLLTDSMKSETSLQSPPKFSGQMHRSASQSLTPKLAFYLKEIWQLSTQSTIIPSSKTSLKILQPTKSRTIMSSGSTLVPLTSLSQTSRSRPHSGSSPTCQGLRYQSPTASYPTLSNWPAKS